MENLHSSTWCPLPFLSLTIHPTGKLTHCMMSEEPMGDLNSGWDNENFQTMRKTMLAGNWNLKFDDTEPGIHYQSQGGELTTGEADCGNCYLKESRGLQSQRQNWLNNMRKLFEEGTYESACNITDNQIYHLNLNLSNICNFKCRMCSPNYSNSLIPDFNHLHSIGSPIRYYRKNQNKQIIDVDYILEQYGSQLSRLNTIWVTGGEPLMDDRLFDFTRKLENYTDITKVKMFITTNGSKIDISKFDVFDKLDVININVSVDATGDLFSYMRSAGIFDWQQLENVINDLRAWQKNEKHPHQVQLSYNASFQAYNSYNAAEFFSYFDSLLRRLDWIEYRMLTNPDHLAVHHMPDHMKLHSAKQLQNFLDTTDNKRNVRTINNLLQSLKTQRDPKQWQKFIQFTVDLDCYRNQYLYDHAPDLYNDFDSETLTEFERLYNAKNN